MKNTKKTQKIKTEKMKTNKSNCCDSETEIGKGTGIYDATTGFLLCKNCGKYCAYKYVEFTKDTLAESNNKDTSL